jgi:hypothetical protein
MPAIISGRGAIDNHQAASGLDPVEKLFAFGFAEGNAVLPTTTIVAGFGPLKLRSEAVDSRQRATW